MTWYAGIDIGATKIRAVVADGTAEIEGRYRQSTPQSSGVDVTEAVLDTLRAACRRAGIEPQVISAVGIGSIGPLDSVDGAIHEPANLPDSIEEVPLVGPVENLVDAPVYLHNDANAGVIGQRFFVEPNPDNLVYLTISSGIGAGVVVDGSLVSGWNGNAGEVGHIPLDPSGELACGCGKRGHWEAYCSGNNIPRYARHLHEGQETSLPLSDPSFEAADVFEHAGEDTFADHVLERVEQWNALGITALVHAYAPMVVYVGGAVASNNPTMLDGIRQRVPDLVVTNVPDIQLSTLGEDIVVKGALASAMTGGTGDRGQRNPGSD